MTILRTESKPPEDSFLSDPDNIHIHICCIECRKHLWEQKLLKRSGTQVLSTETKPLYPNTLAFDKKLVWCPLCGKDFYAASRRGQSYLIYDVNSKIQRLI